VRDGKLAEEIGRLVIPKSTVEAAPQTENCTSVSSADSHLLQGS
jgi:hypothetical protein